MFTLLFWIWAFGVIYFFAAVSHEAKNQGYNIGDGPFIPTVLYFLLWPIAIPWGRIAGRIHYGKSIDEIDVHTIAKDAGLKRRDKKED